MLYPTKDVTSGGSLVLAMVFESALDCQGRYVIRLFSPASFPSIRAPIFNYRFGLEFEANLALKDKIAEHSNMYSIHCDPR